nr:15962_t:CDS:2 [Entrophospora candida]
MKRSNDNAIIADYYHKAAPLRLKQSINQPSKIYQKYSTNIIRRTVYLGNLPSNSVKLHPDNTCAFISFMNAILAKAFYDEAMTKQIFYEGQKLYVSCGRPSAVPLGVQLAVDENNASHLAEYGYIDTIQIIRGKKIGLVHFLNISSAIRAVKSLPLKYAYKEVKVDYAKDRCEIYMQNTLLQSFGNNATLKAAHNPYPNVMSTTHNHYFNDVSTTCNPYLNDVSTTCNPYLNNVSTHDHNFNAMHQLIIIILMLCHLQAFYFTKDIIPIKINTPYL